MYGVDGLISLLGIIIINHHQSSIIIMTSREGDLIIYLLDKREKRIFCNYKVDGNLMVKGTREGPLVICDQR
jgi:hypothetical protein